MQEQPILFSGEMVKAILAGRKTQTRRVIKDYPWTRTPYYFCGLRNGLGYPASEGTTWAGFTCEGYHSPCYVKCPYGQPGDLLWVRERFNPHYFGNRKPGYAADYDAAKVGDVVPCPKWTPSIFMPRWASRILLAVVDVRVERLQEMNFNDWKLDFVPSAMEVNQSLASFTGAKFQREHSRDLWDKINAKRGHSWDSNPWVWVIEFRRKI